MPNTGKKSADDRWVHEYMYRDRLGLMNKLTFFFSVCLRSFGENEYISDQSDMTIIVVVIIIIGQLIDLVNKSFSLMIWRNGTCEND